ncbi:hypothetical protein C1646_774845 [Rhizophagus diaphanus]|nr:hypothetical protein C1646_774845 [Rhizophagus diaphanus] [Rhizophagus sp. MUCL 43196]
MQYFLKRNGNYPLISTYEGEFVNIFHSLDNKALSISTTQNSIVENNNDNYIVDSDDEQHIYETDLAYLCGILDKTKELLEESRNKPKCHLWVVTLLDVQNFKESDGWVVGFKKHHNFESYVKYGEAAKCSFRRRFE